MSLGNLVWNPGLSFSMWSARWKGLDPKYITLDEKHV